MDLQTLWDWLLVPENREILGWLGGGMVVLVTGLWAVVKFRRGESGTKPPSIEVTADRGSIAAGRDAIVNSETPGRDDEGDR